MNVFECVTKCLKIYPVEKLIRWGKNPKLKISQPTNAKKRYAVCRRDKNKREVTLT